jgi:transposase
MPAPFSLDLRQRVWALYEKGEHTRAEVAARFGVSESFCARPGASGAGEGRQRGGQASRRGLARSGRWKAQLELIREAVERKSDATLEELKEDLKRRHRFQISRSSLWRALVGTLGLTRKKEGPPRQREGR